MSFSSIQKSAELKTKKKKSKCLRWSRTNSGVLLTIPEETLGAKVLWIVGSSRRWRSVSIKLANRSTFFEKKAEKHRWMDMQEKQASGAEWGGSHTGWDLKWPVQWMNWEPWWRRQDTCLWWGHGPVHRSTCKCKILWSYRPKNPLLWM